MKFFYCMRLNGALFSTFLSKITDRVIGPSNARSNECIVELATNS